jgi:NAD(P)-dependent dehydrogenase (short-subunit alcohol dehydrogenase family)
MLATEMGLANCEEDNRNLVDRVTHRGDAEVARSGKTALVTGASAGLGLHFARVFARNGHDLVLVARRQDRLDQLATELSQAYGTRSTVIAADLTDPKTPLSIHKQLIRAGIEVDFLVTTLDPGIMDPSPTMMSLASWISSSSMSRRSRI